METARRSIVKAVSYRFFGTLTTSAIVMVVLGKVELAAAIGITDTIFKIGVYVLHERAWNRIPFGRHKQQPEYTI